MPSVGMRRTTRVFGVVKGVDGARVLRSGRRLWPDFSEPKQLRRPTDGDDWYPQHHHNLIKKHGPGPGGLKSKAQNEWGHQEDKEKENPIDKNQVMKQVSVMEYKVKEEQVMDTKDKMFGLVYTRKRKRNDGDKKSQDRKYGIRFSRRRRKTGGLKPLTAFGVVFESSTSVVSTDISSSTFLSLIFGYMKERVKGRTQFLSKLASFLLSPSISETFASCGVRFLWEPPAGTVGLCKLFLDSKIVPTVSVDFSAVPFYFMHIYRNMFGALKCLPTAPVNSSVDSDDDMMVDEQSLQTCKLTWDKVENVNEFPTVVPDATNPVNRVTGHPSIRGPKLSLRGVQYRNGVNSRAIQKRRSSLRRKRSRNLSSAGAHKANGALVSDLICSRKNGIPFSSVVSKNKPRSSMQTRSSVNMKENCSNVESPVQDLDPSCCSAVILVMDLDRCYREEGATVVLELSPSREWLLAVKKAGVTKYTLKAQKVMRPPSSNRFSHAIVWNSDENWKLEFPIRQDWLIFKDLYKDCFERNTNGSNAKVIPVPGVCEVSDYESNCTGLFQRPDSYISVHDNEVARALAKRTAIYDMDSEDEEWLKKFNCESSRIDEHREHVSEENFELMVDALEKANYCSPDDYSNQTAAVNLCVELGRQDVVQAVHSYWMQKRKQKRAALLRVFQCRQVKKAPLIPKPALRKRRSFKRQASNLGRGKQPVTLKAIAAERDAMEEANAMQDAVCKVEEAKFSARDSMESAIHKRKRAQLLMEIADLATYKAMTALRIAEAAEISESVDAAAAHFLD